ncbi:MAG TPA: hypothetical protein VGF45_22685 [Polyangia bacterium]
MNPIPHVQPCADREDALALLAGGDLPSKDAEALNAHLTACITCRETLARFQAAVTWTKRGAAAARLTLDERRRVHARVTSATARSERTRRLTAGATITLAVAAAIVLVTLPRARDRALSSFVSPAGAPQAPTTLAAPVAERDVTEANQGEDDPGIPADELAVDEASSEEAPPLWSDGFDDEGGRLTDAGTLRIELGTSDPTIKIVWLARK